MASRIRNSIGAFFRDTNGAATMEFVVLVPFLMIIVFMFAEIGILTGRTVLLKRGVSIAARDIRLGVADGTNDLAFRHTACINAFLINNCTRDLLVDIAPINVAARQDPTSTIACRNRVDETLTPATDFNVGGDGNIMIVKTCLIADPVFPGTGLAAGLTWADGRGYAIIVKTAFMNECDDEDNCV